MPIYAYKCASCGHSKDVLQKISDAPLTVCPSCGAAAFTKQITAAGFQLKGSGWYVTDFRGGSGNSPTPAADSKAETSGEAKTPAKPAEGASGTGTSGATDSGSSPAAASASCGASCSCH